MLVHYNLLKIVKVCVYKSIKQSCVWILLIPDNISIKEELISNAYVGVDFYNKPKFKNNAMHKSQNGADKIFNANEN